MEPIRLMAKEPVFPVEIIPNLGLQRRLEGDPGIDRMDVNLITRGPSVASGIPIPCGESLGPQSIQELSDLRVR
jgi:hypothetical protein